MGVVGVGGRVRLVAGEDHRLSPGAEDRRDVLVETGDPGTDVDHQDAEVGLLDGHPRLLLGAPGELGDARVLGDQRRIEAGRVHQVKRRPRHSATPYSGSRVSPAVSSTMACRCPVRRLKRVDFPTLAGDDGDDAAHRAQGGVVVVPAAAPVAD